MTNSGEQNRIKIIKLRLINILSSNAFTILSIIAVIVGFALGYGLRFIKPSGDALMWLGMPGRIFINLLKLTILPLISSNLIIVIAKLDAKENGRISILAFIYIIFFNIISAAIGIIMTIIIKPGQGVNTKVVNVSKENYKSITTSTIFSDLLINLFPENVVATSISKTMSYIEKSNNAMSNKIIESSANGTNFLGVLFISISFGLAAKAAGPSGQNFINFFESLSKVVLQLINWFLLITPIGICSMIIQAILEVDEITEMLRSVGLYIVTFICGIAIHFILILIVYVGFTRQNPLPFIPYIIKSWLLSFMTTSPIVSLPEMYEGCDKYGIDENVSRFICPFTVTLKADGAAVFISCSCMFLAQISSSHVSLATTANIWILTSVAVLAIPPIPSASIIIIISILSSLQISIDNTSLLFAIDWLMDRIRSGSIAISTMYAAALISAIEKKRLENTCDVNVEEIVLNDITSKSL